MTFSMTVNAKEEKVELYGPVLYHRNPLKYPIISQRKDVQAAYEAMRADGTSHTLAEMFAFQHPPMSNSDKEFLEGHANGSQFQDTPYLGDHYRRVAEQHGQNVKGKVYLSGLAKFPGDPEAWVSGRGDVQKLCETRGWDCDGSVKVNAFRQQAVEGVDVADDILNDAVTQHLKSLPPGEEKCVNKTELREQIREKKKPHWKPRTGP